MVCRAAQLHGFAQQALAPGKLAEPQQLDGQGALVLGMQLVAIGSAGSLDGDGLADQHFALHDAALLEANLAQGGKHHCHLQVCPELDSPLCFERALQHATGFIEAVLLEQ
jgi:hypothetical protein